MTDPSPAPACIADPVGAAEAAATLLRTGRTTMALTLLEGLPDLVRAALDAAKPPPPSPTALQLEAAELTRLRAQARELVSDLARLRADKARLEAAFAGRRRNLEKLDAEVAKRRQALERLERPPSAPAEPRPPKPHELLSAALAAGTVSVERAAEVLGLQPRDIAPIASGRVGLAAGAWRKLLAELEMRR